MCTAYFLVKWISYLGLLTKVEAGGSFIWSYLGSYKTPFPYHIKVTVEITNHQTSGISRKWTENEAFYNFSSFQLLCSFQNSQLPFSLKLQFIVKIQGKQFLECIGVEQKTNLPSTTSWEVGGCPMRPIQDCSRSSAISSSTPWALALLQKYISHACKICIISKIWKDSLQWSTWT